MKVRIPDTLKLPPQAKVEVELLKLLAARSRPLAPTEAYRALADTFRLTSVQQQAPREGSVRSSDPAWNWLVRRAMQHLKDEGWAYHPQHGFWAATEEGRSAQRGRDRYAAGGDIFADED
jgi:hypothetical protein